jgi:uncharacterized protein
MIIDVLDLLRKKTSRKSVHLVYKEENFLYEGENIQFLSPITLNVELYVTGDVINLEGSISTELSIPCSRCLANFNYQVNIPVEEKFSNNPDDKNDNITFIEGDTIDITDIIKNNIITSLPIKKLCKVDCKGLCQHCGENLNLKSCNCVKDDVDPRLAKLKDLFSAD